jgi:predicted nucleotidyltransferase
VTETAFPLAGPEYMQAQRIVRLVREVLGGDVLGAYLHGSAVLGGLRPTSDLDILVVIERRPTTATERRALVEGLLDVSGARARGGPARPVELSVVVQGDIKPWRYPPRQEFLYGEWLRDAYEQGGAPEPEPAPDLAVMITMVLEGDAVLVGPPPAQVLDPVPPNDLIRGSVAGIPHLMGDLESDTRNVLLTLTRIWCTLETGQIRSKDSAAAWALAQLPPEHQPPLVRARDMYLQGEDETRWADLPAVRAHAEYVVKTIRALV